MKIGEVARRTGLSVRTLHHYDELGLLSPEGRSEAGHRLYGETEISRLQQILSLRQLGLSLQEIGDCLDRTDYPPDKIIRLHLDRVRGQIDLLEKLRDRLEGIAERLSHPGSVSIEEVLQTIEVTTMLDKYYTKEQLEQLEERRVVLGDDRIQQAQAEWMDLFERYRKQMERGADPASEPVLELARRSRALIAEFTGGDAAIQSSLETMYQEEGGPGVMASHGFEMDPALWEYMSRASAALEEAG